MITPIIFSFILNTFTILAFIEGLNGPGLVSYIYFISGIFILSLVCLLLLIGLFTIFKGTKKKLGKYIYITTNFFMLFIAFYGLIVSSDSITAIVIPRLGLISAFLGIIGGYKININDCSCSSVHTFNKYDLISVLNQKTPNS